MYRLFPLFFLILLVAGCIEPEEPMIEPNIPTCNLDVLVYKCPIFPCDEATNVLLEGKLVSLFSSHEDARNDENLIATAETDSQGRARFINIPCDAYYVKVKHEPNGTYIAYENLTIASTLNFHEVRFVANNFYDFDDSAGLRQAHISLEYPTVGMESRYRYFENYDHVDFTPLEYTDAYLTVRIVNQVNENSFIVEETIGEDFGTFGFPDTDITSTRTVWTITEDEVYVSPLTGEYFFSYIWNLSAWFEQTEGEGYSFSLIRPEDNEVDMAQATIPELFEYLKTGPVSDYVLFGNQYMDLSP